jgi:FtsZ-binding cell division protein ZapB
MDRDEYILQMLGELKEANNSIATSMNSINNNLKILNDHNILHAEKTCNEHNNFQTTLQTLATKYWYLIIGLMVVILIIMGYKEAAMNLFG